MKSFILFITALCFCAISFSQSIQVSTDAISFTNIPDSLSKNNFNLKDEQTILLKINIPNSRIFINDQTNETMPVLIDGQKILHIRPRPDNLEVKKVRIVNTATNETYTFTIAADDQNDTNTTDVNTQNADIYQQFIMNKYGENNIIFTPYGLLL